MKSPPIDHSMPFQYQRMDQGVREGEEDTQEWREKERKRGSERDRENEKSTRVD